MHYIIDGYNVINSSDMFSASTLEGRRDELIEFVRFNRPHGNGSPKNFATVVFDFKSKNPYESRGYTKSQDGDVEIIFSNGVLSADDIIAELVDKSQNQYGITVVTNDKGLLRRISSGGAKHESVEVFLLRGSKVKNVKRTEKHFDERTKEVITEEFIKLWLKK
jgi:predicted RNA-binding protein with PIN domain